MPRLALSLAAFVLLAALAPVSRTQSQALFGTPIDDAPLGPARNGLYRWSGAASEERALDRAIDACVDRMDFVTREFARGAIRARLKPPYDRIRVDFTETRVATWLANLGPWRSTLPEGRITGIHNHAGEPVTVTQTVRGTTLVQILDNGDGRQRNTYSFAPDGRTLRLDIHIASPQLPAPIHYALTYLRP